MLQKSVEDFAENDIKFKKLVKDAVREELKSYKQHISKMHKSIFNILEIHGRRIETQINHINAIEQSLEDLRMNYKDFKRDSVAVMKDQIKNLDNIFDETYKSIDKVERKVLIKMEAKFQSQRNDINVIAQFLEDLEMDFVNFLHNFSKFYLKEKEEVPTELIEVFKKMEAKFQSQRNDINVIAQSLRELQMDYKDFKKKYEIERKIENLDKANSNKVEILDIEGNSDGK